MSHTKTFDCDGCRPYCYGGYHMREDADGDGDYVLAEDFNRVKKQRDELLAALEDTMIMIGRIKKHCQITDNAGYTLDGRMLKLTDVEQSSSAAIANTRKAMDWINKTAVNAEKE